VDGRQAVVSGHSKRRFFQSQNEGRETSWVPVRWGKWRARGSGTGLATRRRRDLRPVAATRAQGGRRWRSRPSGPLRMNGPGARWVNFGKEIRKRKGEIGGLVETHGAKSIVGCKKILLNFLQALWVQNSKIQSIFELNLN
jgi:hypothetical protein